MKGGKPLAYPRGMVIFMMVLLNVICLREGYIHDSRFYGLLLFTVPLLMVAIFYSVRRKDRVLKNGEFL